MTNATPTDETVTSPRAHGLSGLSYLTANLPADVAAASVWMATYNAALDEGDVIVKTQGIDALVAAIKVAA